MRHLELAILACLTAGLVPIAAPAPLLAQEVESLKGAAASLQWEGTQFVQADPRGDVYLLRGDTLQVYPVTKNHDLGEPVQLEGGVRSGMPLDAAMGSDDSWALLVAGGVRFFPGGHEKSLPALAATPLDIGFLRGDPVVVVMPRFGETPEDNPPLLLRLGADSWSPELRQAVRSTPLDLATERAYRAAMLLDGGEGRYLLASHYAYRVEARRLGRQAPVEELRVGAGEPAFRKPVAGEEERILAEAKAAGTDITHAHVSVFRGTAVLLALARGGPEGRLYALVAPGAAGGQCALDRIDWEARRVERVSLGKACEGPASLAAGRDGLYIAPLAGNLPRSFVPWSGLEAAKWSVVKEAVFAP